MLAFLIPLDIHTIVEQVCSGYSRATGQYKMAMRDLLYRMSQWGWDLEDLAVYWYEKFAHRDMRGWREIYRQQHENASICASTEFFTQIVGEEKGHY